METLTNFQAEQAARDATIAFEIAQAAQPIFELKGWTYVGASSPTGVPSVFEIGELVYMLLTDLRERDDTDFIRSGRFEAARRRDEEGVYEIAISLELYDEDLRYPLY